MSAALWCDSGEHAFSSKDPDKQHFTKQRAVKVPTGNSYGTTTYSDQREIVEEFDICGPCASSIGLFQGDTDKPKTKVLETKQD